MSVSLAPGDIIDVIAPGWGVNEKEYAQVATLIRSWGYHPRFPENMFEEAEVSYLSGEDETRFTHLEQALTASDSKVIWCVRGGYGCSRLMGALTQLAQPAQEKCLIGFSDVTALHLWLTQKWGWKTLHAPVIYSIIQQHIDEASIDALRQSLKGEATSVALTPANAVAKGASTTVSLTGGNLALIAASLATPWHIDTKDKVVVLEDFDEPSYRIDRMLTQLIQARVFAEAKGIILGNFTKMDKEIELTLTRFINRQNLPIWRSNQIGHGRKNMTLPFNEVVRIEDDYIHFVSHEA